MQPGPLRLWLEVRPALEAVLGCRRLDRFLDRLGFAGLKSRVPRSLRRLPDGNEIFCRPDDEEAIREIHEAGAYAAGFFRDGDTVVDVGADIGVFAVKAARQTPQGRVVAVEPAPLNLELLRENAARNRLANISIVASAVSDHEGQTQLFSHGDDFTPVRVSTLDRIFQESGIGSCQLLRIDVAGEELAVLRGAAAALRATKQVIMRIGKTEDRQQACRQLLADAGFSCRDASETPGALILFAWQK